MRKFLGIDVGTSSVCGVLCGENGTILATSTVENDAILPSKTDESFQDPARIFAAVERTARRLLNETARLKNDAPQKRDDGGDGSDEIEIGLTGQMHGILYLDSNGNAVSPLATWQDRRADRTFYGKTTYVEYLTRATGRKIASGFGLATHFFNAKNGLVPRNAAKIATIADFVATKLSGKTAPVLDPSNASSLGLFDVETNRFDVDAVRAAGIDPSILPEIAAKPRILARRFGRFPVWTAIGDNQASFLGSVDVPLESVCATVGTSAQLSVFSEKYRTIESLDTRPFPGGGFLLVGAALCGGSSWTLLRDFFAATLAAFGAPVPTSAQLFASLARLAEQGERIPNAERLQVETTFAGTRLAPEKRGKIANISPRGFSPEALAVAFLDGIADELFGFFQALPHEERPTRRRLVGSGNGLRQNPALVRAVERKFGLPLETPPCETEAAFGAAQAVRRFSK